MGIWPPCSQPKCRNRQCVAPIPQGMNLPIPPGRSYRVVRTAPSHRQVRQIPRPGPSGTANAESWRLPLRYLGCCSCCCCELIMTRGALDQVRGFPGLPSKAKHQKVGMSRVSAHASYPGAHNLCGGLRQKMAPVPAHWGSSHFCSNGALHVRVCRR